MQIRILKNSEISFLKEMLYEAIFIPEGMQKPPKSIINDQLLAHYYENWGKDIYDIALVIEIDGEFIGAIWGRKFFIKEKGYGFFDEDTPEISMAIKNEYRSKGLGTKLIEEVIKIYKDLGLKALSLSVDKQNLAYKLYVKQGFSIFSETETSVSMIKYLS
jgi:ribosomal protein S18 acetylase RimI-like enzyme